MEESGVVVFVDSVEGDVNVEEIIGVVGDFVVEGGIWVGCRRDKVEAVLAAEGDDSELGDTEFSGLTLRR